MKPAGAVRSTMMKKYISDSAIADCIFPENNTNKVTNVASRTPRPPTEMGRAVVTKTIGTIEK